jgi:hypothetical protein
MPLHIAGIDGANAALLRRLVWIGLSCLVGCSFRNLDALSSGSSMAAGAGGKAAGGAVGLGGVVATNPDTLPGGDSGAGGAGGDTAEFGGAAGSVASNAGSAGAGFDGGAGRSMTSAGTSSTAGSGAQGIAGAAGAPGKVQCPEGWADCNGLASDGCEADLNSLIQCGNTCADAVVCAADQVCNAHKCGAPQGLVKMSLPFTQNGQAQRYADKFLTTPNLTNTALTLRLFAPGATGGAASIYAIDNTGFTFGVGSVTQLVACSTHWCDVVLRIGPAAGDFDPVSMYQVAIEFQANDAGPWLNPTAVYLDSVRCSNGLVNDNFNTALDAMVTSTSMVLAGAQMTWVDHIE